MQFPFLQMSILLTQFLIHFTILTAITKNILEGCTPDSHFMLFRFYKGMNTVFVKAEIGGDHETWDIIAARTSNGRRMG